jgi:hypothetical protein
MSGPGGVAAKTALNCPQANTRKSLLQNRKSAANLLCDDERNTPWLDHAPTLNSEFGILN